MGIPGITVLVHDFGIASNFQGPAGRRCRVVFKGVAHDADRSIISHIDSSAVSRRIVLQGVVMNVHNVSRVVCTDS